MTRDENAKQASPVADELAALPTTEEDDDDDDEELFADVDEDEVCVCVLLCLASTKLPSLVGTTSHASLNHI